ncbi:hypothetical protein J6590_025183 [Homalodisca vitripennis]|nr:hypothetical protein J6590_025183 [Homalodisca vitripennis]
MFFEAKRNSFPQIQEKYNYLKVSQGSITSTAFPVVSCLNVLECRIPEEKEGLNASAETIEELGVVLYPNMKKGPVGVRFIPAGAAMPSTLRLEAVSGRRRTRRKKKRALAAISPKMKPAGQKAPKKACPEVSSKYIGWTYTDLQQEMRRKVKPNYSGSEIRATNLTRTDIVLLELDGETTNRDLFKFAHKDDWGEQNRPKALEIRELDNCHYYSGNIFASEAKTPEGHLYRRVMDWIVTEEFTSIVSMDQVFRSGQFQRPPGRNVGWLRDYTLTENIARGKDGALEVRMDAGDTLNCTMELIVRVCDASMPKRKARSILLKLFCLLRRTTRGRGRRKSLKGLANDIAVVITARIIDEATEKTEIVLLTTKD